MEGLHARKKNKTNPEDELEYMDESKKHYCKFRNQNDAANSNILKGLFVIDCLTSSLFLSLLVQSSKKPIIPIANIIVTVYGSLGFFRAAVISSILSVSLSFIMLITKSKIDLFGINRFLSVDSQHASMIGVGALLLGMVGPIMCLFYNTNVAELVFWAIPLLVSGMYYVAYYMMKQVQKDLEELEQSKYKYKGA
ncbi:unnamed protein product [Rhizopus stolonifer]